MSIPIEFTPGEVRALILLYQEYQDRPSRELAEAMDKLYVAQSQTRLVFHPAGCICLACVAKREAK